MLTSWLHGRLVQAGAVRVTGAVRGQRRKGVSVTAQVDGAQRLPGGGVDGLQGALVVVTAEDDGAVAGGGQAAAPRARGVRLGEQAGPSAVQVHVYRPPL